MFLLTQALSHAFHINLSCSLVDLSPLVVAYIIFSLKRCLHAPSFSCGVRSEEERVHANTKSQCCRPRCHQAELLEHCWQTAQDDRQEIYKPMRETFAMVGLMVGLNCFP